jgi:hypothetical protein
MALKVLGTCDISPRKFSTARAISESLQLDTSPVGASDSPSASSVVVEYPKRMVAR